MRSGSTAIATSVFLLSGTLLGSSPASAQANGDPGSALLGIARAQTHRAVEKGKDPATPAGEAGKSSPSAADAAKTDAGKTDAGKADAGKADASKDGNQSVANVAHHD